MCSSSLCDIRVFPSPACLSHCQFHSRTACKSSCWIFEMLSSYTAHSRQPLPFWYPVFSLPDSGDFSALLAFLPLGGQMSVDNARALLLHFHGMEGKHHFFFQLLLVLRLISLSHTLALQVSCIQHWGLQELIFPSHYQMLEFPQVLTSFCLLSSFSHSYSMWFHGEWLSIGSSFFNYTLYTFSVVRNQDPAPDKILLFVANNG